MQIHYHHQNLFPAYRGDDPVFSWTKPLYRDYQCQRLDFQPDFSLTHFRFHTRRPHLLTTTYDHPFVKLVLCLSGHSVNHFSGSRYGFQAGQLLLYTTQPGVGQAELRADTPYELIHLHLPPERLQLLAEAAPLLQDVLARQRMLKLPIDAGLASTVQAFRPPSHPAPLQTLSLEILSLQLLHQLAVRLSRPRHDLTAWRLHECKSLLDTSPRFLTIQELARTVGTNESSLKAGFRAHFGTTIFAYQQNLRLQQAYERLQGQALSVRQVAEECGYGSVGSFSNAFRKKFGLRPSELGGRTGEMSD